jgi:hypothetical protein
MRLSSIHTTKRLSFRLFTKTGDCTTLRFLFAFSRLDECYGDISSIAEIFSK